MYLNMLGTNIVVLNSSEAIADLLDKRSAIYSDKVPYTRPIRLEAYATVHSFPTTAPITNNGTDRPE